MNWFNRFFSKTPDLNGTNLSLQSPKGAKYNRPRPDHENQSVIASSPERVAQPEPSQPPLNLVPSTPDLSIEWTDIGKVAGIPHCLPDLEMHASRRGTLSRIILIEERQNEWGSERAQYEKNYIDILTSKIKEFETNSDWAEECRQVRDVIDRRLLHVLLGTLPSGQRIVGIVLQDAKPASAESRIPGIFQKAYGLYQTIMAAAKTGSITPTVEDDLYEALKWLDELCKLDVSHGEPHGLRGAMYMILAQINKQTASLDRAEEDFLTAIKLGSKDRENISTYKQNLADVKRLRSLL